MRAAHCMVKLNNMTQSVDNNLCEDARLPTPVTIQKCETDDCPQWTVTDWKPCEESKCFTWNTGKTIGGGGGGSGQWRIDFLGAPGHARCLPPPLFFFFLFYPRIVI